VIVRVDFGRELRRPRTVRVAPQAAGDIDLVADLGARLPFKDDTVDEIYIDHAVAHVDDFMGVMQEIWRISKPGAIVHLRLPHASSSWALSRDPRHSHHYTLETFNYFDPRFQDSSCPTAASFRVEHARLYLAGARRDARGLALARGAFSGVIEGFANQNRGMQYRWERWFAPMIGGFEEFYVVLSVLKDTTFG
jgi:SAM-dependent methyltransferase